jgi:hypothetical protein
VIRTRLVVAGEEFEALVNLTTRDEMTFRMLLGRRTLRNNFLIDPGRSYLGERPTRKDPTASPSEALDSHLETSSSHDSPPGGSGA